MLPKIFIGSSVEGLEISETLQKLLDHTAEGIVWTQGVFELSGNTLDSLIKAIDEFDFGIFVFTPDDIVEIRGEKYLAARDNVVFELGMFIGRLGKERSFILIPRTENLHLPSDLNGIIPATYDPKKTKIQAALGPAIYDIKDAVRAQGLRIVSRIVRVASQDAHISIEPHSELLHKDGIFPVYRNLDFYPDWYIEFENALRANFPSLDSRMVYYGPSLAKNWIKVNSESLGSQKMRETFNQSLAPLLRNYLEGDLNLIDLGVGDFDKGQMILHEIIRLSKTNTLNYIPLDISYDMLALALDMHGLSDKSRALKAVFDLKGTVTAINASFDQLHLYKHLFRPPSKNLFLLLGNTLGNEMDEVNTLVKIRAAMCESDILIAELQLIEEQPYTIEELSQLIQPFRDFYAGPFLALGCGLSEFQVVVRHPTDASLVNNDRSITYAVMCDFERPKIIRHIGFSRGEVRVRRGSVGVHVVRKYYETGVASIFEEAGFEVLKQVSTRVQSLRDRRFHYIVARPQIDTM